MTKLRNPKRVTLPDGVSAGPVEGFISGELKLQHYPIFPFGCSDLTYVATPGYFFLKGVSEDGKYELILSGAHTLEANRKYRISEQTEDVEAQFYIHDDMYVAYGPATGELEVTAVTPDGDYKAFQANAKFDFLVFDQENNSQTASVDAYSISFKAHAVKEKS